ncbi:MAG TPA: hypothetical protein PL187_16180, partial [Caldilinea sp.]|nr:hypothetical protein [Caldilinea sp.]
MTYQHHAKRWWWTALLVLVAMLASACAAPAAPSTPATGGEEAAASSAGDALTRANTLIFALDHSDLITLDPAVAYEFGGILPVGNMYETLISFNPGETALAPVLATSWDVADDGELWKLTFT